MEHPSLDRLVVKELLGSGGSGRVFRAAMEDGTEVALKIFDEQAVCRKLLEKTTRLLADGGWPAGVLPVIDAEFGDTPAFRISPLVGDRRGDGSIDGRTLQHLLDDHPGLESWKLVKSLAQALAAMHERRVVHGNLKPGNMFIHDDGGVLLADWALGNMPGITEFHFTDAVLYQAPEQLQDPSGYADGSARRWDVFAFGVISFRVLTGLFPRCHETFNYVAPPPGETSREGLKADLKKIAANIVAAPVPVWPDEPRSSLEAGFRKWIDRCLEIDPVRRPATMGEVVAGFAEVEAEIEAANQVAIAEDARRRAERSAGRSWFALGAAAALTVVFAGLWHLSNTRLSNERLLRADEIRTLKAAAESAFHSRDEALKSLATAEKELAYERELWHARIESSRLIGDRLFGWAMEKGHRRLPALDGRELRLKRLERYFVDFLTRTAGLPGLADEHARARLQLAEISLASGDAEGATKRLDEALKAWSGLSMDGDFKFRMAHNALLLALLRQERSDPATGPSFAAARKALAEVPRADVDADRLDQLSAVLDFHEAKLLAAAGDDTKALEQLMRATQTLNRIADLRPDAVILRSELAACYLSSATILEGMGSLGDAREVRSLASAELQKLLGKNPKDSSLKLDLAGCYGAMAEAAVLSGDITGAESLSREALKLLDEILIGQPDNTEAVSRKAAQLGLRAGIQRDRGQAAEALKDFDEGIRMLEGVRASSPGNAMASYRLSLLWWQKGRMLGISGDRDGEITLSRKARDLLGELEAAPQVSGPRPEQLQRTTAYLCGDLGHAFQLAGRSEDAARAFTDAVALWQRLLDSRPQSEEYSEGLAWCKQRLADVQ